MHGKADCYQKAVLDLKKFANLRQPSSPVCLYVPVTGWITCSVLEKYGQWKALLLIPKTEKYILCPKH